MATVLGRFELVAKVAWGAEITGPLCARESGFTLHAATRAGAEDERAREALLRYVLRRPVSQKRITEGPDGLVRITLKKPFSELARRRQRRRLGDDAEAPRIGR
jgi:hypothetical protein